MSFQPYYEIIVEKTSIKHVLFLVTTCGRQTAEVCLCLFTLKGFKATLSNPADVKCFVLPLVLQFCSVLHISSLSPSGTIICFIQCRETFQFKGELSFTGHTETKPH